LPTNKDRTKKNRKPVISKKVRRARPTFPIGSEKKKNGMARQPGRKHFPHCIAEFASIMKKCEQGTNSSSQSENASLARPRDSVAPHEVSHFADFQSLAAIPASTLA